MVVAIEGFNGFFQLLPEKAALHTLTVGAIGTMTLAVMTRASLGHTGRAYRRPSNDGDLRPDNSRSDTAPIFVGRRSSRTSSAICCRRRMDRGARLAHTVPFAFNAPPGRSGEGLADLIVSQTGLIPRRAAVVLFCRAPIQISSDRRGPPNIGGPMDSFASMLMLTLACKPFSV
nr:NnrS family protein [Methylocystis rosea]